MIPSASRIAFRHLTASSMISIEVRGPKEIMELIEMEAKDEFKRGVRRSHIRDVETRRPDGRIGSHLMLIIDADRDAVISWASEQARYDYSGDIHEWRVRENGREVRLGATKFMEHFKIDGEEHRVRGLANDSGVRFSQKPHMRKWVLEHRVNRNWKEDAAVYLPNKASIQEAKKKLGV